MKKKQAGMVICIVITAAASGWALTTVDVGGNNSATYPATWAGLYAAITNASAASASDDVLVRISNYDGVGGAANYVRSGLDMTNGLGLVVTNWSPTWRITVQGGYSQDFSAQSGRSTIDGNIQTSMNPGGQITSTLGGPNTEAKRVFTLGGTGGLIVLKDLTVTGGGVTAIDSSIMGAGIYAGTDVRLSNLIVSKNSYEGTSGGAAGGGICLNYAGSHVIEYCEITQNRTYQGGGGLHISAANAVLVANCIISGNRMGNAANHGAGIYSGKLTTLFNCAFFDNFNGGSAFYKLGGTAVRTVNCTFADNATTNPFRSEGSGNWQEMRNCVFADNTGDVQNLSSAINKVGHSVFDDDRIMGTYTDEGGVTTNSPMVFKDQPNRDYRLTGGSVNAVDLGGYLRTGDVTFSTGSATVKYVDVDNNGAYAALTDVIVKLGTGAGPADTDYEAHHIYTKDLAGNRRIGLGGIDIGAYEYLPPRGTVVMMK